MATTTITRRADRRKSVGASTIEQLRSRAQSLRETAATLDPIAAEAFERRARQLEQGVVLLQEVLAPSARRGGPSRR